MCARALRVVAATICALALALCADARGGARVLPVFGPAREWRVNDTLCARARSAWSALLPGIPLSYETLPVCDPPATEPTYTPGALELLVGDTSVPIPVCLHAAADGMYALRSVQTQCVARVWPRIEHVHRMEAMTFALRNEYIAHFVLDGLPVISIARVGLRPPSPGGRPPSPGVGGRSPPAYYGMLGVGVAFGPDTRHVWTRVEFVVHIARLSAHALCVVRFEAIPSKPALCENMLQCTRDGVVFARERVIRVLYVTMNAPGAARRACAERWDVYRDINREQMNAAALYAACSAALALCVSAFTWWRIRRSVRTRLATLAATKAIAAAAQAPRVRGSALCSCALHNACCALNSVAHCIAAVIGVRGLRPQTPEPGAEPEEEAEAEAEGSDRIMDCSAAHAPPRARGLGASLHAERDVLGRVREAARDYHPRRAMALVALLLAGVHAALLVVTTTALGVFTTREAHQTLAVAFLAVFVWFVVYIPAGVVAGREAEVLAAVHELVRVQHTRACGSEGGAHAIERFIALDTHEASWLAAPCTNMAVRRAQRAHVLVAALAHGDLAPVRARIGTWYDDGAADEEGELGAARRRARVHPIYMLAMASAGVLAVLAVPMPVVIAAAVGTSSMRAITHALPTNIIAALLGAVGVAGIGMAVLGMFAVLYMRVCTLASAGSARDTASAITGRICAEARAALDGAVHVELGERARAAPQPHASWRTRARHMAVIFAMATAMPLLNTPAFVWFISLLLWGEARVYVFLVLALGLALWLYCTAVVCIAVAYVALVREHIAWPWLAWCAGAYQGAFVVLCTLYAMPTQHTASASATSMDARAVSASVGIFVGATCTLAAAAALAHGACGYIAVRWFVHTVCNAQKEE